MSFCPAVEGDAHAIADIWNDVITASTATFTTEAKDPDRLADAIRAGGGAWRVAVCDSGVAGFACHQTFRAGPGYRRTREHSIHVAPSARGRGLGRALMRDVEDHARGTGARLLVAAISAENSGALAFHDAVGFTHAGRIAEAGFKFGRHIDLVLMQKILTAR